MKQSDVMYLSVCIFGTGCLSAHSIADRLFLAGVLCWHAWQYAKELQKEARDEAE